MTIFKKIIDNCKCGDILLIKPINRVQPLKAVFLSPAYPSSSWRANDFISVLFLEPNSAFTRNRNYWDGLFRGRFIEDKQKNVRTIQCDQVDWVEIVKIIPDIC